MTNVGRWQLLSFPFPVFAAEGSGAVMEKFDGKNGHDNMQRNKVTHRPRISYASATHKLRIGYACELVC